MPVSLEPLEDPPSFFSRRQMLIIDGLRYAFLMADVSYQRLVNALRTDVTKIHAREIAGLMADAWSIIDNGNRFQYLLRKLAPSVPWLVSFDEEMAAVNELRRFVQHQMEKLENVDNKAGYMWGYLSWAEVNEDGAYTGRWLMASPGSVFGGDEFVFTGPLKLPFAVPPPRVRLDAYGHRVYLGRVMNALKQAIRTVAELVKNGAIAPDGHATARRVGADEVASAVSIVIVRNDQKNQ